MQGEQCTSLLLRYLIAALPIEESGTTVKYEASIPRLESDAATLASALSCVFFHNWGAKALITVRP